MSQDEIIRMAREAGFTDYYPERLTRFAALVAANEREKFLNKLDCVSEKVIYETVKEAVLAEREACANVCEEWNWSSKHGAHPSSQLAAVAAAIRARNNKEQK